MSCVNLLGIFKDCVLLVSRKWEGKLFSTFRISRLKFNITPKTKLIRHWLWINWNYPYKIFSIFTFDVRRSDYYEMATHHIATISLLSMSFTINFVRIGTLILFIHDSADIFLSVLGLFAVRKIRVEQVFIISIFFIENWANYFAMLAGTGLWPLTFACSCSSGLAVVLCIFPSKLSAACFSMRHLSFKLHIGER